MSELFDNIETSHLNIEIKKKRKKQKLERLFSEQLRKSNFLYHKLHNNPLAHQTTHADFEVFTKSKNVYFIEAKEIQLKNGKGIFPFSRLTQRNKLIYYNNFFGHTYSYLLLMFRDSTMVKSHIFLIPINTWVNFENNIKKKSANLNDILNSFGAYELSIFNGHWDLSTIFV